MKTAGFYFMTIGCAVLIQGVGYAGPSSAAAAQPPSGNFKTPVWDHPPGAGHGRQPGSSPPDGTAHRESVGNKTASDRAVPPPGTVLLTEPLPKNARSQGSSPVIIGGPANSTKNMAAINGTGMNRKR
jgi:hypothetical protein